MNSTYSKLVSTYTTIRQQSGGARLYVVGYPQIAKVGGDCGLNVHLNSNEVLFSSQLISYLDGVVQRAAKTAGVYYVDTQHAFDGHRLCEAAPSAMNGLTAGGDAGTTVLGKTINFIGAESYHPTPLGYQLLAHTIAQQTNGLATAMPVPGVYAAPEFNANADILQGVPKTGRQIDTTTYDNSISDEMLLRGDSQQVMLNSTAVQMSPGSDYQIVLHSTPLTLATGTADAAGNINQAITLPTSVEPGFHTLNIYGKDLAGDDVDVQKIVYVAASATDYNGDGVPNSQDACLVVPPSGQDADHDGVDDACDTQVVPLATASASTDKENPNSAVRLTASTQAPVADTIQPPNIVLGNFATTGPLNNLAPTAIAANSYTGTRRSLFTLNWLLVGIVTVAITFLTALYLKLQTG
jgi:hypothetical protein